MGSGADRVAFRLYLITDRKLAAAHGGLSQMVAAALDAAHSMVGAGAVALQVREKDLAGGELYALARELRAICRRYGAPILINERLDIALAVEADGVHLPADSFAIADARRLLGASRLIGVSTHSAGEVSAAREGGADFAVCGPLFASLSKPGYGRAEGGAEFLGAALRAAGAMPLYALGGLTAERVHGLARGWRAIGAPPPRGLAVIGAVLAADRPADAVRDLLRAMNEWQRSADPL
ncbi:MAG TPA: thiamine phosphate synthase [Candidatus Binataceae bacterium]|nr:thiamine phosphate synthase [Candidatus Binataceae bacterium]